MVLEATARNQDCLPPDLFVFNTILAFFNGFLAVVAFSQLVRMHMRNREEGWTRQKVLHFMVGSSNLGYLIYFISALIATCQKWVCWSNVCGFILMAYPKILFLAAFLLFLSFWVDLCHQANDDEDDDTDNSIQQALLENSKNKPDLLNTDVHWSCCSFESLHVGIHQKFVIVVVILICALMITFGLVVWIGAGKNPIDSSLVAQVYEDFLAIAVILLGGALGCYGSLVPSAFVLWIMRELPPPISNQPKQARVITFVSHGTAETSPRQLWASATSSKNEALRSSPI